MDMSIEETWDFMIENMLFTEEELQLVTQMVGYTVGTLNDALYARYGYHDLEQYEEGL